MKYEEEQQTNLEALRDQQRKVMETQQYELKIMQADKSVALAEVKLKAFFPILCGRISSRLPTAI